MKTAQATRVKVSADFPEHGASPFRPGRHAAALRRSRRGQTLTEYAIIISVIVLVAIGVLLTLGQQTQAFYSGVVSQMGQNPSGS